MISQRMKETVGIRSDPRRGVDYRIVQSGTGRRCWQNRKKLTIDCVTGGRLVFDQVVRSGFDSHAAPLASEFEPNIDIHRNTRSDGYRHTVRLETGEGHEQPVNIRRNVLDNKTAIGSYPSLPPEPTHLLGHR